MNMIYSVASVSRERMAFKMRPLSYVISVAKGSGVYRHIQIGSSATLLDLHQAILSAYEITEVRQPSFMPLKSSHGKQSARYSLNNTKNTIALRDVKLSDTDFAGKSGMVYALAEPRIAFMCRTIRVLEVPTGEPSLIRASGSGYSHQQTLEKFKKALKEKGLPQDILLAMAEITFLPADRQHKITEYHLAATNLYGIVPISLVHDMYCRNQPPISLFSFAMIGVALSSQEDSRIGILDQDGLVLNKGNFHYGTAAYIVEYSVLEGGVFQEIFAMQAGKPYYRPSEEELLRYADIHYVEKNTAFLRLRAHLESLGLKPEDAENCVLDIQYSIRFSIFDTQEQYDILEEYGVQPKSLNAAKKISGLLANMSNNTRTHFNCGYTAEEIIHLLPGAPGMFSQKSGSHKIPPPSKPSGSLQSSGHAAINGNIIPFPGPGKAAQKPGRNAPCPCGSGKKFKHCCCRP